MPGSPPASTPAAPGQSAEPAAVVIDVESIVAADSAELWRHAASPAGVNEELWPLAMSFPRHLRSLERVGTGSKLFRSRIALFGLVPVDWHDLGLERIEPSRGFREVSSSLWMARWVHERTLDSAAGGTRVRDHVEFTPRLRWLAPLMAPLYRGVFGRRHRRLRRKFGAVGNH